MYGLVGLASLATDFLIYNLMLWGLADFETTKASLIAHGVSRPIGGLVCFYLNKIWTFQSRNRGSTRVQLVRFWCIFGMSTVLTGFLIWLSVSTLGPRFAKLAAEGVAVIFNYLTMRFWAFKTFAD